MMLQLKYTLDEDTCGWATLELKDRDTKTHQYISVSYLRDTLSELCLGITHFFTSPLLKYQIICECEPGAIALELSQPQGLPASYRLLHYEDEQKQTNPEVLTQGHFDPHKLARDIFDSCSIILKKHSLDGYLSRWAAHPFPMQSYLNLQQIMDHPSPKSSHKFYKYIINTGNKNKQAEFSNFFKKDTTFLHYDIKEPQSTEKVIIRYKASHFENVIVDDTSLHIHGKNFGPLIKWNIAKLDDCVGDKAIFSCLLAKHQNKKILASKGEVQGRICKKQGDGFGFTPYFIPDGSTHSLAEERPNHFNARYLACKKVLENRWDETLEPLYEWTGEFQ